MKKKTMAWGCALLMGLTLTACGADASKFTGYIEDLDMQGAYSYYEDHIDSSKKKAELDQEISESMDGLYDKLVDQYIAGNLDSEKLSLFKQLASDAEFSETSGYSDFLQVLAYIDQSKQNYDTAMQYYDQKDYDAAIAYFGGVMQRDTVRYEEAQKTIEACRAEQSKQLVQDIQSQIQTKAFEEAHYKIEQLKNTDKEEADKLVTEYDAALKADADARLTSYFDAFDYEGAVGYLAQVTPLCYSSDLSDRQTQLADEFVVYVLKIADKDADAENYEGASAVVKQAMNALGQDNEKLSGAYDAYRSHLPVYLVDLDYMSCKNHVATHDTLEDNTGNMYHNALFMYKSVWGYYGEGSADYFINGKYATFSGTVAVPRGFANDSNSAYFEVYGDGKLLYTSPTMKNDSFPEAFDIDISGVKVLKIYYPDSNGNAKLATIYDGKLNPKEADKSSDSSEDNEE